jgi:hypothetical protein
VLLSATVVLGRSVVSRTGSYGDDLRKTLPEVKAWLKSHGCDSVYGTDLRTGDEWAVPNDQGQITNIRVSGYYGLPAGDAVATPALQPFWLWPQWVHTVADSLGVNEVEVNRFSTQSQFARNSAAVGTVGNFRVNAAGRPIHSDGRFMSYATARRRGWQAIPLKKDGTPDMRFSVNKAAVARPSSARGPVKKDGTPDMRFSSNKAAAARPSSAPGPLKKDGTPDMRFSSNKAATAAAARSSSARGPLKANGTPDMRFSVNKAAYYGGGSSFGGRSGGGGSWGGTGFSGSARYSVSSNPTGPLKANGTPDMRYSANRR